ncbi:MAG: ABC transporter ATP-binding protein [Pseudomonadota bacterium]
MDTPLLEVCELNVSIGATNVVENLSLVLEPGQSLGLLGPNGVGKTTLLKTLAGVHDADHGEIRIHGRELNDWPRKLLAQQLGLLPQHTQYAFEASCEETALIGRHPHLGALAHESASDHERARQALNDVGLKGFNSISCIQLSGGESRRLALATLLVQDPVLLLLDEPTNHLDPAHQIAVLDIVFDRVAHQRRAAIMALHDANLASCYCSHVLLMFGNGVWSLGPAADQLTEQNLSRLYGCRIRRLDDGRQQAFIVAARAQDEA